MNPNRYSTILFDWGDTVMIDNPSSTVPMVEWETVKTVPGIDSVLACLHSSGRRIVLATSASISDEGQIRGALARGCLDKYFSGIFCFKNTGLPKGEEFYRFVLDRLDIPASEALMVGDSFEKDVLDANKVGINAVWFNPKSERLESSQSRVTVHSMSELLSFFRSLDR